MTTVSIALASYNGARYIGEQLASLVSQTRPPDEVIVSDDGSTDDTLEIARAVAAAHPSLGLRIVANDRDKGYTGNFVTAFAATTCDVVMPCDQDDAWRPAKIERMVAHLEAHPACQLVMHDLAFADGEMRPLGQTKLERIRSFGDPMRYYTVGMGMAVRRPFLAAATSGFQVPGQAYDNHIARRAQWLGAKDIIDDVLADYRRHGENASQTELFQSTEVTTGPGLWLAHIRDRMLKLAPGGDLMPIAEAQAEFAEWLDEYEGDLIRAGMPAAQIAAARRDVGEETAVVAHRLALRRQPRAIRLAGIARLYAAGGYARFSGARAAAKDMALPRLRG